MSKSVRFLENVAPLVQEDFQNIIEPLPAPDELPNVNFNMKPKVFTLASPAASKEMPIGQFSLRQFQSPPNIIGGK